MRLTVSIEGCEGHGNCYALCPSVFAPDEEGYSVILDPHPPESELDGVRRAVANCPERAITVSASEEIPAP